MVFSDLHVGDRNKTLREGFSDKEIRQMLTQAMAKCDRLVLAGDIVELLFPERPETALETSLEFLKKLSQEAGKSGCSVEFLFGNHEYAANKHDNSHTIPQGFVRGLQQLEHDFPGTFRLHPVAYRFGGEKESVLVWHGDLPTREYERPMLNRRAAHTTEWWRGAGQYSDHGRYNRIRAQLETVLGVTGAHRMLDAQEEGENRQALGKVTRICFGHTHDPFVGASLDQHTFPKKAPKGMPGKTYADRLHLAYDNPGTAQEGRQRCFPVLYTLKEDGRIKAEQHRVSIDHGVCTLDAVDPAHTKSRHWAQGH